MLIKHDDPRAATAAPHAFPDLACTLDGCGNCASLRGGVCCDPQSIFCNDRRHPLASCPHWVRAAE